MKELTEQQKKDIERLKPWALSSLPKKYDGVCLFKVVDGESVYHLYKTEWGKRHKIGMPILAIIEDGMPKLLDDDEVLGVIVS